ncbi:MAG: hypothetical protein ACR9NN_20480 [Nostochopsis sp.]
METAKKIPHLVKGFAKNKLFLSAVIFLLVDIDSWLLIVDCRLLLVGA